MAFVPAPQIMMAEIRYILHGQHIENRVMVDALDTVTAGMLSDLSVIVWNWAELSLFPNLSNEINLNEVVCTDLTTITGAQVHYAPDTTTNGGQGSVAMPNECAFCVTLKSASRGRSARGRMFIPAIPRSGMADANNLSNALVTALVTSVQQLVTDISGEGWALVIVSYISGGAPRAGGPVYFPVTSAGAFDSVIDSQKRRKPGVGI